MDKEKEMQAERKLTETAVSIVNHEISSQGSGGEVVDAARAVCHIPHHYGIRLCEPRMYRQ